MKTVVLVNGLPGAGKTTLATNLAPALGVPLFAKDAIKESMPEPDGRVAAELLWTLAAGVPGTVLLESWWFKPRDLAFVEAGLRRCAARTVIEIWCDVPAAVARQRFATRRRAALHQDEQRLVDSWPQWARLAEPLGLGTTLRVRTDRPVELGNLVRLVTGIVKTARP